MRSLSEILSDVRERVSRKFSTVRISTMEVSGQLLLELKALNESRLPAVVVILNSGQDTDNVRKEVLSLTLVLIDRFVAGSDEKALSALNSLQRLRDLFPRDVTTLNGVHYCPVRFYACSTDPKYACFAFEIEAQQA